jgi:CheY-like chemotaxis protein
VRATHIGDRIAIEIEDTGSGIAPELTSRIFEPFYTTKPADQGTGLGLSISRDVIVSLGGSISVRSELGAGSTFRIELPIATAADEPQKESTRKSAVQATPVQRILVLDDEPLIGEFLSGALEGHQVDVTTDANEALQRVTDGQYDLVLCDLRMPRMSGTDVYEELSRRRPDLCSNFVLMTGAAIDDDLSKFLATHEVPVLRKPFVMNDLLHFVARAARKEHRPRRAS